MNEIEFKTDQSGTIKFGTAWTGHMEINIDYPGQVKMNTTFSPEQAKMLLDFLNKQLNPKYAERTAPDDFQFNIIQPNGANEI